MTILHFVRREQWGADVWEYFFQSDLAVPFLAGQYASFILADVLDVRGNARTFTMTSLPTDALLSFAVKISANPSPFKQRLANLKIGDTVLMGEPMGDLILPRTAKVPLLFIAGGLGVASYVALLRTRTAMEPSNPVSLLWAVRSQTDLYNLPIIDTIDPTDKQIFLAPNRLYIDDIIKLTSHDTLIYLSGSEHFVSSLLRDMHAQGITDTRILFDYFSGYEEL